MFHPVEPRARGGSGNQSFLSLDDGHSSSPPRGSLPNIPSGSLSGSSSIPSGQYLPSSPQNAYDVAESSFEAASVDSSSDSFPRHWKRSQQALHTSPPRSSRQGILQTATRHKTPERETARSLPYESSNPTDYSHEQSGPTKAPSNSRGGRLGALISRNLKGSHDSPTKSSSTYANESDDWHPSSVNAESEPPSGSLASRLLRPRGSRQLLKDTSDPAAQVSSRPEGNRLGAAFGFHQDTSRDEHPGSARSASALGMLSAARDDSPTLPEYNEAGQRRPLGRPSSHSNLLQAATTQAAASGASSSSNSRGGRLGKLQYNRNDSISVTGVSSRDSGDPSFASYRSQQQQQYLEHGPSNPIAYGSQAYTHDGEVPQDANDHSSQSRDWQKRRVAHGQTRSSGPQGITGLGIGTPTGSSSLYGESYSQASSGQPQQPRELVLPSLNARNSEASQSRQIPGSRHASVASKAATEVSSPTINQIGQAWTESDETGRPTPQPTSSRAASRASLQDSYHNRFSNQSTVESRVTSQQSSHQTRDTATSSRSAITAESPAIDPGSPIGGLSDAAIVALGATPGQGPESLLNANGAPLSSKNVLTIALQKAQSAVQLDSANNVPEAIAAYKQAVRLLQEVMERIAPKNGRKTRPSREEERRRLRVIHDTYADRIRLLSMIYSPEEEDENMVENGQFQSSHDRDRRWTQDSDTLGREMPSSGGMYSNPNKPHSDEAEQSFLLMTPGLTSSNEKQQQEQRSQQSSPPRAHRRSSSLAVSLADEAQPRPPQISIQTNESQEVLQDPDTKAQRDVDQQSLHNRSDSGSSFQSSTTANRLGVNKNKSFGLDEELKTPVTPYFDAADSATLADDGQLESPDDVRRPKLSSLPGSQPQPNLAVSRAAKLQPADKPRSVGLRNSTLRSKASMPSLPKMLDGEADGSGDHAGKGQQRRPSTADSPPPPDTVVSSAAPAKSLAHTGSQGASPPAFEGDSQQQQLSASNPAGQPAAILGRPRAATLATNSAPGSRVSSRSPVPFLVNSSTNKGTISQRRKQQGWPPAGENDAPNDKHLMALPGTSEAMLRAKSADEAGAATVRGRSESTVSPHGPFQGTGSTGSSSPSYASGGRQRALSQPGSRRPSIPAAFISANAASGLVSGEKPPPVPRLLRKLSAGDVLRGQDSPDRALFDPGLDQGSAVPVPPRLSTYQVKEAGSVGDAGVPLSSAPVSITDIFPSGLPSLVSGTPSFTSGQHGVVFPWLGLSGGLPSSSSLPPVPSETVLQPFHTMRMLMMSMRQGGYVTPRLYVPKGLWVQQGARLMSIESKVRAVELICSGIESVSRGGEALLRPLGTNGGLETSNASRFVKHLDEFDSLLFEVQNTLAKKLGFLETGTGKKAASSFGSIGSKLTRSLDRMTNGPKGVDSPIAYVESLARLFQRAQVLDQHLQSLLRSQKTDTSEARDAYFALPAELKGNIEARLKRSSDFFANVVLTFVLRDVGVLLDKFVKRGSSLFTD